MKTIIAGSRDIKDSLLLEEVIRASGFEISLVVCGGATGVDALGESFAYKNKIPLAIFPANWTGEGKSAGPLRNQRMAEYADACIVICKKDSKGSRDMARRAARYGLKLYIRVVEWDSTAQLWLTAIKRAKYE